MKKILCIFCVLTMLFCFCSCKDDNAHQENEYETMKTSITKDSVKEFMELLGGEIELGGLSSGFVLDEEHCYNVTPQQVASETDMKIFKFSDSCASFVMFNNEIYPLCEWFGGYGFVNAVPCDFDNDGNKDLLVASSWGSGMHRSIISIFNSVSKETTILYDTSNTEIPQTDLFVAAVTPSYSSKEIEDLPIYYQVYSAEINVNDMEEYNLADLSYVATDLVGFIEIENGKPIFKPYQKCWLDVLDDLYEDIMKKV